MDLYLEMCKCQRWSFLENQFNTGVSLLLPFETHKAYALDTFAGEPINFQFSPPITWISIE